MELFFINHIMKRLLLILTGLAVLASCCKKAETFSVIPQPNDVTFLKGSVCVKGAAVEIDPSIDKASRGYKEINLRALKMIRPGGYLITCSCSQHISPELFQNIVVSAAKDAHVSLRQIEFRTQGRDHPILPTAPETQYLKCGIYQKFE